LISEFWSDEGYTGIAGGGITAEIIRDYIIRLTAIIILALALECFALPNQTPAN